MKKMLRKSAAILSSAMIASVLAIPSLTAFAADNDTWANIYKTSSMTIDKEIVVTSEDTTEHTAPAPAVEYSYAVEPATVESETTVTDRDDIVVEVQSGIAGGFTLGTDNKASFTGKTVPLKDGTGITKDTIDCTIDASKFPGAGIYRYKLTETAPEDMEAKGVLRPANYDAERFVDIYIKVGSDGKLEPYGTVVFENNDSVDGETHKTTGFTEVSDITDPEDDPLDLEGDTASGGHADIYPLFDYQVKKAVVNDTNVKEFTFKVTVSGTEGQTFKYGYDETDIDKLTEKSVGTEITQNLKNGDYLYFQDLPANVTFMVSEENLVANSAAYDVDVEDTKLGVITVTKANINSGETTAFNEAVDLVIKNDDNKIVLTNDYPTKKIEETTFTNTYHEISVTGLLFTYAPYAAFIGVGTLFIGLFIRNKKRKHEDSEI